MSDEVKELKQILKCLKDIEKLLQQSIVFQLCNTGLTQDEISKKLKMSKPTVNYILKGVKKKKG